MTKRNILDWLFRLHLIPGVRVDTPPGLIECSLNHEGQVVTRYKARINDKHDMAGWLLNDCEGPWAIGLRRPYRDRRTYLSFARKADAVAFRLLSI